MSLPKGFGSGNSSGNHDKKVSCFCRQKKPLFVLGLFVAIGLTVFVVALGIVPNVNWIIYAVQLSLLFGLYGIAWYSAFRLLRALCKGTLETSYSDERYLAIGIVGFIIILSIVGMVLMPNHIIGAYHSNIIRNMDSATTDNYLNNIDCISFKIVRDYYGRFSIPEYTGNGSYVTASNYEAIEMRCK